MFSRKTQKSLNSVAFQFQKNDITQLKAIGGYSNNQLNCKQAKG